MDRHRLPRQIAGLGFAGALATIALTADVYAQNRPADACRWTATLEKYEVKSVSGAGLEGNKAETRLEMSLSGSGRAQKLTYPKSGYKKVKEGSEQKVRRDIGTVTVRSGGADLTLSAQGTEKDPLNPFMVIGSDSERFSVTCDSRNFVKTLDLRGKDGSHSFRYLVTVSFEKK